MILPSPRQSARQYSANRRIPWGQPATGLSVIPWRRRLRSTALVFASALLAACAGGDGRVDTSLGETGVTTLTDSGTTSNPEAESGSDDATSETGQECDEDQLECGGEC